MSVADQVTALQAARDAIEAAIVAKGVPVPPGTTFIGLAPLINAIETGSGTLEMVDHLGEPVTVDGDLVTIRLF